MSNKQEFIDRYIDYNRLNVKETLAEVPDSVFLGPVDEIQKRMTAFLESINTIKSSDLVIEFEESINSTSAVVKLVRLESDSEYNSRIEEETEEANKAFMKFLRLIDKKYLSKSYIPEEVKESLLQSFLKH